jgi:hypothetical protein
MKTYIISYDLLKPGRDYSSLHEAIKALSGYWAKPLESFWIVRANSTAAAIRDYLKSHMDINDKLFVASVGSAWAGSNLGDHIYKWLKENWVADRELA